MPSPALPRDAAVGPRRARLSEAERTQKTARKSILRRCEKTYAVRTGHRTGILDTWAEVEASITGFVKATYKAFAYQEDAMDWLHGGSGDLVLKRKWIGVKGGSRTGVYRLVEEAARATGGVVGVKTAFFETEAEARRFIQGKAETPAVSSSATTVTTATGRKRKREEKPVEGGHEMDDSAQLSRPTKIRKEASMRRKKSPSFTAQSIATPNATPEDISDGEIRVAHGQVGHDSQRARKSHFSPINRKLEVRIGSSQRADRKDSRCAEPFQDEYAHNTDEDQEVEEFDESDENHNDISTAQPTRVHELNSQDFPDIPPRSHRELQLENELLRAELSGFRKQATSKTADRYHSPHVYTLLLARDNGKPPKKQGPHPEQNMAVLGTFRNLTDVTEAAWNVLREHCIEHNFLDVTDHGVSDDFLDREDMKLPGIYKRVTQEGETRLYWRDHRNLSGFIMVQKQHVRNSSGFAGADDVKTAIPTVTGGRSFAYIVCENYEARVGKHQDGGMFSAYDTAEKANTVAERLFRGRYMGSKTDSMKDVRGLGETMFNGHGTWRVLQNGRTLFVRDHENGRAKVWVEQMTIE